MAPSLSLQFAFWIDQMAKEIDEEGKNQQPKEKWNNSNYYIIVENDPLDSNASRPPFWYIFRFCALAAIVAAAAAASCCFFVHILTRCFTLLAKT